MHKKERSRNPVTPDKIPAPLLFDMYSFQSERRLIYHTILYSFSVRYLLFEFTSFFFKYTYHEITKSANISNQCNHHHNNCIHRHKEHLLSQFYLQFSSFVIRPFAVLRLKNLPSAIPTTITTPNCNSTVPVLSCIINGFSHVSGNHSFVCNNQ